jgi:hypothetical protein
MGKALRQLEKD